MNTLTRRVFFAALPATGAMFTLSAVASDGSAIVAVIQELESWQGWESTGVVCTKAYAAYRMRQALGLDLPDPKDAQGHLEFQKGYWDAYRESLRFERDRRAGKAYSLPPITLFSLSGEGRS